MKYILQKDNKTVTLFKIGYDKDYKWNYKKEIGSTIIDTYDLKSYRNIIELKFDLLKQNYKIINQPSLSSEIIEMHNEFDRLNSYITAKENNK